MSPEVLANSRKMSCPCKKTPRNNGLTLGYRVLVKGSSCSRLYSLTNLFPINVFFYVCKCVCLAILEKAVKLTLNLIREVHISHRHIVGDCSNYFSVACILSFHHPQIMLLVLLPPPFFYLHFLFPTFFVFFKTFSALF